MKKNTMQSLADALGVSRITVWKALNHKEGVSETLPSAAIACLTPSLHRLFQRLP